MLESFNGYMSFFSLLFIIFFFLYFMLSRFFRNVERNRIKRAMIKREKEQKGEA